MGMLDFHTLSFWFFWNLRTKASRSLRRVFEPGEILGSMSPDRYQFGCCPAPTVGYPIMKLSNGMTCPRPNFGARP